MSDELIERRTLRGRIGLDQEPPVPGVTEEQTPAEAPPKIVVDELPQEDESPPVVAVETGADAARPAAQPPATDEKPSIALEPPPEAGDVIHKQMDMPTRLTLRPITGEMYSPDLPWEVIESPPFEVLSPQPPEEPQPEPEPPSPLAPEPEPEPELEMPPSAPEPEPEPEPVPPPAVFEPEPEPAPPPAVFEPEPEPEPVPPPAVFEPEPEPEPAPPPAVLEPEPEPEPVPPPAVFEPEPEPEPVPPPAVFEPEPEPEPVPPPAVLEPEPEPEPAPLPLVLEPEPEPEPVPPSLVLEPEPEPPPAVFEPEPEPEPVPPPPVLEPEPEPEPVPPPPVLEAEPEPGKMPPPPEDTARLDSLMLLPAIRLDEAEFEVADEAEVEVEDIIEEAPPAPEAEEPETLIAQKTPPRMPGVSPPAAELEEPPAEQAVPPDERIPLPSLTPTGLGPVPDEPPQDEAVDVDWVVAVGERMERDAPPELVREEAPPPDLTDEISPPPRKKSGQLSNLVMVLVLSGLLIFVVVMRFVFGVGGPTDAAGTATEEAAALPPVPTATLAPTLTPTPLPPTAQGRIAFAADRDGDFEIYVLDMVTGALMQLTDNEASDRSPAWSPDGSRIVYVSDAAGDDDLYVMEVSLDPSAGGSNAVKLTTDPAADHFPAWSPDGKTIIFSRETLEGSLLLAFDTECLDAGEGACEDALWAIIDEAHNLHGRWSPDGKRIAFTASSFPGKPSVIALINPTGDGYSARVGTGSTDFYPAWSPDGERIAFVSSHMGDFDLWLMTVDDGSVVQLTRSEGDDVEPAWSPDGQFIVFASDREGTGGFDLYLLPVDCESSAEDCEEAIIRLTSDDTDELNPAWTGTR